MESVLGDVIDKMEEEDETWGEVLLYLCALTESDLNEDLADSAVSDVKVIRLGTDEISLL